jgi:hypothetical protein
MIEVSGGWRIAETVRSMDWEDPNAHPEHAEVI